MRIVVIGAGLAGGTAVTALREAGHRGPLTLLGAEKQPPYERPPLSKSYLMGDSSFDEALLHEQDWYAEHDIDLRLSTPATQIDRERHIIVTQDGEVPYDKLVLATGSTPRHLPMADESGVPVAYLRNVEDSDRIREHLTQGARIVIIGAGWIGLEVASAARKSGAEVTVFERESQPLLGVLGPDVAARFAEVHRAHGVDLRLEADVTAEDLKDAHLVIVGIGAVPNTELAEQAGLDVEKGAVLVDATLRTSDPDIYAVGDIAAQDHPRLGRIRVEHWDTAIEQAKIAAHNLTGSNETYDRMPYFFTDQYDLGMEYFGHGSGSDRVVTRGDLGDGSGTFRAYWIREGKVVAAMHANDWDASDELRDAVDKGVGVAEITDETESTLQEVLEAEHHAIDEGIERYIEGLRAGEDTANDLTDAFALLRRHIFVEEDQLFEPVKQAGLAMPVFVMLREHGELWRAMDAIEEQIAADAEPDELIQACQQLLSQLDQHNRKEEPVIYPYADTVLNENEVRELRDFLDHGELPEGWVCQEA